MRWGMFRAGGCTRARGLVGGFAPRVGCAVPGAILRKISFSKGNSMAKWPKDREHLVRMAGLFVAGLALFLIARTVLVPKDFNEFGHFRTGALADNMVRPMAFAGRDTCESCHPDIVDERKGSRHAAIACEACHGALA